MDDPVDVTPRKGTRRRRQPDGALRERAAVRRGRRLGRGRGGAAAAAYDRDGRTPADHHHPEPARRTSPSSSPSIPIGGCEHGCVYCYARPTHAYLGLSPGLDFESILFSKPDAAALLEKELARPGYRCRTIALGTNTDPYQPVERELGITRGILEVLAAHDHPVSITTKSNLVLRDVDILAPMARLGLAAVGLSVTTLDRTLARTLEPRAPTPARRLETIAELAAAGVPVSIMAAPMIPVLNDWELERILEAARAKDARAAGYILLRLPLELKALFTEWLEAHAPAKAKHVLSLLRESRDGMLYVSEFGSRMRGSGGACPAAGEAFRVGVPSPRA